MAATVVLEPEVLLPRHRFRLPEPGGYVELGQRGREMPTQMNQSTVLHPEKRSAEVLEFESRLRDMIVGQDAAVSELVNVYQSVLAGMATPGRPIANLLFLGPTGSGKTRLVEAAAEILFSTADAVMKVDCAEFQHSHEIAKLIGSPPGYIGHRETPAVLNQDMVDRYHTEKLKVTFLLFDEIEKASDALWQLLLGILDKGTLTLGDNRKVNLSRAIIFMTSNLGASEITRLMSGGIGFASRGEGQDPQLEQKIYRVAVDAARRRFSPEFMNRLDKVTVFRSLSKSDLERVLDIELGAIQTRIFATQTERPFVLLCSPEAKKFLLAEGTDLKYGARHLKRALERHLVLPLSSLLATEQIFAGDTVTADIAPDAKELVFSKSSALFESAAAAHGGVIESSAIL
jgi:ATP-dependent Clp protease ATP-binding subunit ClpA